MVVVLVRELGGSMGTGEGGSVKIGEGGQDVRVKGMTDCRGVISVLLSSF